MVTVGTETAGGRQGGVRRTPAVSDCGPQRPRGIITSRSGAASPSNGVGAATCSDGFGHLDDARRAFLGHTPGVLPVRVLVVDGHRAFAEALARRLSAEPDLDVVGVTTEPDGAVRLARVLAPHAVVLDMELGAGAGSVSLARSLARQQPAPAVVAVAGTATPERLLAAVRAGVKSWIAKDAPSAELVAALRGSVRGESHVSPLVLTGFLAWVADDGARHEREPPQRLTARQHDVLRCLVAGLNRDAVAAELRLSPHTVRTHVQQLLTALGAHTALEAAALGRQHGVRPWDADEAEPPGSSR